MKQLPEVWSEPAAAYAVDELRREAVRRHTLLQLSSMDEADWPARRQQLRDRLRQSLGAVRYDPELPLDATETGSIRRPGYTIRKLTYQSRPGIYVTANLYWPDGPGPFPAVLNMHGHWAQGRLAARVQQRGHILASCGYACLSVDAWGSGERASVHGEYEYHGGMLGAALLNLGETLMGAQIVDNMRGVDLLASLPQVDAARIGATGASGGGNQTMWLAAMDDRIAAAMPVVSVGTFQSYVGAHNCICELLPDGLTYTEEAAVLALVAPRALKICNCLGDSNPTFFPAEMLRSYQPARQHFRALGAEAQLSYQIFNLPHGYWPEIQEAMLGFFDFHLKGEGHGAPRPLPAYETLPESELMVFPPGERPPQVKSIAVYCRERGEALAREAAGSAFDADAKRVELRDILRAGPRPKFAVHLHGEAEGWKRHTLSDAGGRLLPLLLKRTPGSDNYVIGVHPAGSVEFPDETADKLLAAGKNLVLVDLSGSGLTAAPEPGQGMMMAFHTYSRALLWLGRTVMGEWAAELAGTAETLRRQFGAAGVELHGCRESGVAGLFGAAAYGGFDRITLDGAPAGYRFAGNGVPQHFSMALPVPGLLPWGDLDLAARLAGCPVQFLDPRRYDGTPIAETSA